MKAALTLQLAARALRMGVVCLAVACLQASASAATINIDNFMFPEPADFHALPPGLNSSLTVVNNVTGVIGSEREIKLQAIGTALPGESTVLIGDESGLDALQVTTLGLAPVVTTLTYNGVGNVGLGAVDLTDLGSNDRIVIHFAGSDALPTPGLELSITLTSDSGSSTASATAFNMQAAFTVDFPFVSFLGFANPAAVNSIVVEFNTNQTANVDFEVTGIAAVPEPGSCILLALGGTLACLQVARRGWNRRAS
jgi:hypothetical protein